MKRLSVLITLMFAAVAIAENQTWLIQRDDGSYFGVLMQEDGTVIPMGRITVFDPGPPTPEPTSAGQLICLRPWSCTLDESDADLTIRESIDATKSDVPYISVLPGTLNQRLQPHEAIAEYQKRVVDKSKAWVFHVVPTNAGPVIANEGPLDADRVLSWIGVPKVSYAAIALAPDEESWLDIDFDNVPPERRGYLEPDPAQIARFAAAANVTALPGFQPIPRSEWSKWTSRFSTSRLAKSIRHNTDQVMGSCVGHSCGNGVEGACYMQAGDRFFRKISMMSMYARIGRSPNSGAYVGDAADEIFESGILPADGEVNIDGVPYAHTHQVHGGFYDDLPSGWKSTAEAWKCLVYRVTDEEAAFRVLMDNRLRTHFGRSSHALSGFCVTSSNKFAYENSWGANWGDYGKSVGYDSRFYDSYTYQPVLRDEIVILVPAAKTEADQATEPDLVEPARETSSRAATSRPERVNRRTVGSGLPFSWGTHQAM